MRWVGIDEAGYGPNLGPMVMTAVIAESTTEGCDHHGAARILDFWGDLSATVDRAGGDPDRLWVDDSKAILCGGRGRDRLEKTCLAAVHAVGNGLPASLAELIEILGAGSLGDAEVLPWVDSRHAQHGAVRLAPGPDLELMLARGPLCPPCGSWRVAAVRSVVVGPARLQCRPGGPWPQVRRSLPGIRAPATTGLGSLG